MSSIGRVDPVVISEVDGRQSPLLLITVGPAKVQFYVHQELLAKTSFFQVHGDPPSQEEKFRLATALYTLRGSESEFGIVNGVSSDNSHEDQIRSNITMYMSRIPDIHVQQRHYDDPATFGLFAQSLYNDHPQEIADQAQYYSHLQLYLLSLRYEAYHLQNHLMDLFRHHHKMNTVKLDYLIWLVGRIGDNVEATPLTQYLIEQVAYDISDTGYEEFEAKNQHVSTFLREGNWKVRAELFKAVVRHAQNTNHEDPAEDNRRWHVEEDGPNAGHLIEEMESP